MNASLQAQAVYGAPVAAIRTPRDIEYEVFARITRRLRTASADGSGGFAALVAALHDNRKLWDVLASDLAGDENGLPSPLRAGLLSLALFTERHTADVLRGNGTAEVLIEINTAVMRGLRGDPGAP